MVGRKHKARGSVLLLFTAVCAAPVYAQQGARLGFRTPYSGPLGSVTGHVLCADTQTPARFAIVTLIPVDSTSHGELGRGGSAPTDLDGAFTISNVTPGDYYVETSDAGYIAPVSMSLTAVADGTDPSAALAALPQVHVSSNTPSSINLSLQRGGTISGRLQWDDGSAASGVQVVATPQPATANPAQLSFGMASVDAGPHATTDDRGDFRLTGLAPGNYFISAAMAVHVPGSSNSNANFVATIYFPGKSRKSDAKAVAVASTEEHDEASFTIDLKTLHTVSGHVTSESGPSVTSGSVRLVDSLDPSLTRPALIAPDGSFTLSYVPEGSYTLTVSARAQRGSFHATQSNVVVSDSDVTGVEVGVTPTADSQ